MPLYTLIEEVKIRLSGKVRVSDEEEDGKMPVKLLRRLIDEAESEVEQDLSVRYEIPFQTVEAQAFSNLPIRPTKENIRILCELKSVVRVLETDFGRGTSVSGEDYREKVDERYTNLVEKLLERRSDSYNIYAHPPLRGLRLAAHNEVADSGYPGRILSSSQGDGGFPRKQINDPSENWWNGDIDE